MTRLGRSIEEYEANGGWSSHFFAENASRLMRELLALGVALQVGRTVVHMEKDGLKFKAYVHHNGRSEEYATITARSGVELLTVHYTEFDRLEKYLKDVFHGLDHAADS
jgi:hypothetical protein